MAEATKPPEEKISEDVKKEGEGFKKEGEDVKKEGQDENKELEDGQKDVQKVPLRPLTLEFKETWKGGVPMSLSNFEPTLVDTLVSFDVESYKDFPYFSENCPYFGDTPREIYSHIIGLFSAELPLEFVSDMIVEESYWMRRSHATWPVCDIFYHGNSWKQLYFERNFNNHLESYELTKDWEEDLRYVMQLSKAYVHNIDVCEFPSHMQLLAINDEFKSNLCSLKIEYGKPNVGVTYDIKDFGIMNSDCISLAAFCSVTHTLTELNLTSNLMTDDHLATLVGGMEKNPTIVNLDLSHNKITDVGCEHLARLLGAKSCVVLFLNLCNNLIKATGVRTLGASLSANKSLLSLNLCLNELGEYGGYGIFDCLMENRVIQRLNIAATGFTLMGVEAISNLLHLPECELISLDISANPAIGPAAGEMLYTALLAKKKMKELIVLKCGLEPEWEAKIEGLQMARKFDEEDFFLMDEELKLQEQEEKNKNEAIANQETHVEGGKDVSNTTNTEDHKDNKDDK